MRATDVLSSDHRLIERLIHALELGADRLEAGEPVRPQFFTDAVRFIRGYADGTHHHKEEGVLFPAMQVHGVPVDGGPITVMLYEHERGREFTRGLDAAALRLASGDAGAARDVIVNVRRYAELLSQHIAKEDNVLFRIAERVLPGDAQDDVADAFAAIDAARPAGETRADYSALVEALAAEMNIPEPVA